MGQGGMGKMLGKAAGVARNAKSGMDNKAKGMGGMGGVAPAIGGALSSMKNQMGQRKAPAAQQTMSRARPAAGGGGAQQRQSGMPSHQMPGGGRMAGAQHPGPMSNDVGYGPASAFPGGRPQPTPSYNPMGGGVTPQMGQMYGGPPQIGTAATAPQINPMQQRMGGVGGGMDPQKLQEILAQIQQQGRPFGGMF